MSISAESLATGIVTESLRELEMREALFDLDLTDRQYAGIYDLMIRLAADVIVTERVLSASPNEQIVIDAIPLPEDEQLEKLIADREFVARTEGLITGIEIAERKES